MYYRSADRIKQLLYSRLGLTLPKLKNQRTYWESRGRSYMDDFFRHGHAERELFFQDMLFKEFRSMTFDSIFEAGCGFGWNIKRCAQEFPGAFVSGIDFSRSQLHDKAVPYLGGTGIPVANANNCDIPFKDNAFDVGFSLGVFMNIHPDLIVGALGEMVRTCRRHIVHMEWNARRAGSDLQRRRAHKTNIISHDYDRLYAGLGHQVLKVTGGEDFKSEFDAYERRIDTSGTWWAGYEGPDKYTLYVIKICKNGI